MTLPLNAEPIVQARMEKQRPKHAVVVSTIRRIYANPTVYVLPDMDLADLDLRFLVGLDVWVAHDGKNIDRTIDLVDLIQRESPRTLGTWDVVSDKDILISTYGHVSLMRCN